MKTNSILADIYDALLDINANLVSVGSGKRAKRANRYPRPGKKDVNTQHIGTAVPIAKINKLFGREE